MTPPPVGKPMLRRAPAAAPVARLRAHPSPAPPHTARRAESAGRALLAGLGTTLERPQVSAADLCVWAAPTGREAATGRGPGSAAPAGPWPTGPRGPRPLGARGRTDPGAVTGLLAACAPRPWWCPARDQQTPRPAPTRQQTCTRVVRPSGLAKDASLPTLRHSWATHLVARGGSWRVSQALLGPKRLRRTARDTPLPTHTVDVCRPPSPPAGPPSHRVGARACQRGPTSAGTLVPPLRSGLAWLACPVIAGRWRRGSPAGPRPWAGRGSRVIPAVRSPMSTLPAATGVVPRALLMPPRGGWQRGGCSSEQYLANVATGRLRILRLVPPVRALQLGVAHLDFADDVRGELLLDQRRSEVGAACSSVTPLASSCFAYAFSFPPKYCCTNWLRLRSTSSSEISIPRLSASASS